MEQFPNDRADCVAGSGAIIGRQISTARLERNLTRRDLGDLLGVSTELVEKYETGKVSVPAGRLYQLSQLFGLPVTEFFRATN